MWVALLPRETPALDKEGGILPGAPLPRPLCDPE